MKRVVSTLLSFVVLLSINSVAHGAELLDVKPVFSASALSIEISADIAMTYSYYKVPGQARAVVDIADADPEKVEPLIVVNKGSVASISVDKAQIAGMVVSRVIFNLISESDIAVAASPDRKLLTVTFGAPATGQVKIKEPAPADTKKAADIETPEKQVKPEKQQAPPQKKSAAVSAKEEDDPLGLDDDSGTAKAVKTPASSHPAKTAVEPAAKGTKLAPVVPLQLASSSLVIKKIVTGDAYIDIETSGSVADYKTIILKNPDRVAIDIAGAKNALTAKSFVINKFGVSTVRIGNYPNGTRIVIDAAKVGVLRHTINKTETGLRISFK
ncbi:MAG TPA: AMIN domain-containing protein [Desulfuromonadales bacterium]|nr:AMIN domain-containing protein [Desulfuromonadales bacterium]